MQRMKDERRRQKEEELASLFSQMGQMGVKEEEKTRETEKLSLKEILEEELVQPHRPGK